MRWSICCISTARRSAQHRSLTERPVFSHGYGMVSQRTADAPAAAEMACFRAEDHAALPRPPLAIEPGGSIFGSPAPLQSFQKFLDDAGRLAPGAPVKPILQKIWAKGGATVQEERRGQGP